jgi:HPr kinase/phosphorylase
MSTRLTIGKLFSDLEDKLGLVWVCGEAHADTVIHSSTEESSDTALAGQLNLINPHRIQVLGRKEFSYLDQLKHNTRQDTVGQLFAGHARLVIIANGFELPADIGDAARATQVPVLSARPSGLDTIQILRYYLTNYFADKITLHGVFMEVMGTGVLITGDSSVGKSELALELITRGHRLIADDAPEFARITPDTLLGSCPEMLRDFLEVRGLGILNVRAMFGASAIKENRNLRLVIVLQEIADAGQIDRLHGSRHMRNIQGIDIPEITLPVGPGRNLAVLLEAAVRNHILISNGYDASQSFIERQKERLEKAHN